MNIDERIERLEKLFPGTPGTQITRVLMDVSLLKNWYNFEELTSKESILVWCLALGHLVEPKNFFYALSIEEVITKAERMLL